MSFFGCLDQLIRYMASMSETNELKAYAKENYPEIICSDGEVDEPALFLKLAEKCYDEAGGVRK